MRSIPSLSALALLAACNDGSAQMNDAIREGLIEPPPVKILDLDRRSENGKEYACAHVESKGPLGNIYPTQIKLLRDEKGKWHKLQSDEGGSQDACLQEFKADLSNQNDSVPASNWKESEKSEMPRDVPVAFDRKQVTFFDSYGDNVIQGSVELKTRSGKIKYCSSEDPEAVDLLPISDYGSARMKLIYGNDQSGFKGTPHNVAPGDPLYLKFTKSTACDEQGRFLFENVPDGEYFVAASVVWQVFKEIGPPTLQGGQLFTRVRVGGSQVSKLTMTAP